MSALAPMLQRRGIGLPADGVRPALVVPGPDRHCPRPRLPTTFDVCVVHHPDGPQATQIWVAPGALGWCTTQTPPRSGRPRWAVGYQLTGCGRPSSYPAADWMPTTARSWNCGIVRAPA